MLSWLTRTGFFPAQGTSDVIVPIELSRQLAELLPDTELLESEGSGHVPTMTRPAEVVDAILRRFP
jgi:pimeloyl-ACP methyl ester carboxylesterase